MESNKSYIVYKYVSFYKVQSYYTVYFTLYYIYKKKKHRLT